MKTWYQKDKADISLAKKEFYPDVTLGVDYIQTGDARMWASRLALAPMRRWKPPT
jgi:outer membrane protein TolC